MRDIDKINRQVHFIQADSLNSDNNTWVYNRAITDHLFQLVSIEVSATDELSRNNGLLMLFDGHEFTQYDLWPGVESREVLFRGETNDTQLKMFGELHGWECKEYTLGVRSTSETAQIKYCVIVWYYLKKMSVLERFYYAVIQPRWNRYKKAFRTTLDPKDE